MALEFPTPPSHTLHPAAGTRTFGPSLPDGRTVSSPNCQTPEHCCTFPLHSCVSVSFCLVLHSLCFLCTFCSSCTTVCGSVSIVCYMSNNNTSNNAGTQCVSGKKEKYNTSTLCCHTFLCFAFTFCLNTDTEMQNKNTESESLWLPAEMR